MATMILKRRGTLAALLLSAVLMSVPTAMTSDAAIRGDVHTTVRTRLCPVDWRQSAWHVKKLIRCAASHYGLGSQKALHIAWRESRFQPGAYNPAGEAAGIYQHLLKYWPDRAKDFGFRNWSAFNGRANILVTMRMVRRYGWDPWGG